MTKQHTHQQHSEKTGHYMCAYIHRHTRTDANDLKDYVHGS